MCKYMQLCCCQKSGRGALASCEQPPVFLSAPNLTANMPQRTPKGLYVARATLFAVRHMKMNMEFFQGPLENKEWLHSGVVLGGTGGSSCQDPTLQVCWHGAAVWNSRFTPSLPCSLALSFAAWEGLRVSTPDTAGWDPGEPQWSRQA